MALKSSNKVETNRYELVVEIDGDTFMKAVDAVRIISRLGVMPPKSTTLKSVVCSIKEAITSMKLYNGRLKFILFIHRIASFGQAKRENRP